MPCDFRKRTVSDIRNSEARQNGESGEARNTLAAGNQTRRIRDKQLQAERRDLLLHDGLNHFNRPVRTRMPGGVGGERSGILTAPIPIGNALYLPQGYHGYPLLERISGPIPGV